MKNVSAFVIGLAIGAYAIFAWDFLDSSSRKELARPDAISSLGYMEFQK